MENICAFNGDADGLCALQQLALADGRMAGVRLISGPKRQTKLLAGVEAGCGDVVTVLDVSISQNRSDVERLLAAGATVRYFDHHAGEVPHHPALCAYIDTSPAVCTSAIVDRHLGGACRAWAVVGAYGDNLDATAEELAGRLGLSSAERNALRGLGIALNYNAYADSVDDMFFHPIALHRLMLSHREPGSFVREAGAFRVLADGHANDMDHLSSVKPAAEQPHGAVFLLPAEKWARRAMGLFANDLVGKWPARAHAVLMLRPDGGLLVSVRAPKLRPYGAVELCSSFETGGGRQAAAGINHLKAGELDTFMARFFDQFA
jgi:hypothetical protein